MILKYKKKTIKGNIKPINKKKYWYLINLLFFLKKLLTLFKKKWKKKIINIPDSTGTKKVCLLKHDNDQKKPIKK